MREQRSRLSHSHQARFCRNCFIHISYQFCFATIEYRACLQQGFVQVFTVTSEAIQSFWRRPTNGQETLIIPDYIWFIFNLNKMFAPLKLRYFIFLIADASNTYTQNLVLYLFEKENLRSYIYYMQSIIRCINCTFMDSFSYPGYSISQEICTRICCALLCCGY